MKEKRPNIITIIGDINMLSAFLLVLTLFPFAKHFGIKIYSLFSYLNISAQFKYLLTIISAMIIFTISYGYLKLKAWGYWSLVGYYIVSLAGWIIIYRLYRQSSFPPAILTLIIGLIYTLPTIKVYRKKPAS